MTQTIGVGIIGYGTVGQASARILREHAAELAARAGAPIEVRAICRRTPVPESPWPYYSDWRQVVSNPEVAVVVETMGGTGEARQAVHAALAAGKPVVTANKNLIARHGDEIFAYAASRNLPIGMEASVAGGLPVIRAIAEGTAADRLSSIRGILNGTTNYILSRMEASGLDFAEALRAAQSAGYAESDPAMDISGQDARDKLCILSRLGFGLPLPAEEIPMRGIAAINAVDIQYARQLGRKIRSLAVAEWVGEILEVSVGPWLLPQESSLAKVEGVNNAVLLQGDNIGEQILQGPGAGGAATGVAVVSDVLDIAAMLVSGHLGVRPMPGFACAAAAPWSGLSSHSGWYLRLTIQDDRPGILARVAELIARESINIDSVVQAPHMGKSRLSFVITVEPVQEARLRRALEHINACEFMLEPALALRIG